MIDLIRHRIRPASRRRVQTALDGGRVDIRRDLDVSFYRTLYSDLRDLSDRAAADHWMRHGEAENRFPNAAAMLGSLSDFDRLPSDYRPYDYVAANPDLSPLCHDAYSAISHYLSYGREEGRPYRFKADDPGFTASWRVLSPVPGILDGDERWIWAPTCAESYLRFAGFKDIQFLEDFDVSFYAAAAGLALTGQMRLASCLVHFVEQGLAALLPISARLSFDPSFYRARVLRLRGEIAARRSDADLYREWLEAADFERSPGTAAAFVRQRFGVDCNPDSMLDLKTYRFANADLSDLDDEQLISHALVDGIFEQRSSFRITHANVGLLTSYADYLLANGSRDKAEHLFRRLRHFVSDYPPLNEHFANLLLDSGRMAEACLHYRHNIDFGRAGPWSYLNAAQAFERLGDLAGAVTTLRKGCRALPESLHMRRTFDAAAVRFFADESGVARAEVLAGYTKAAQDRLERAAELCTVSGESVAPTRSVRTVALFANVDLPQCTLYRVEQKVEQLAAAGYRVKVYDWIKDDGAFRRDLAECDAVIFYRVAAFPEVIWAIEAARAAGLHVFYEIDDLIFDAQEFPEPYESYAGQISRAEYAELALGVPLFCYAMSLCDYAIASTPALAQRMEPLVRKGRAFVHRNGLGRRHMAAMVAAQADRTRNAPITIFYGSGTKAHKRDFEEILLPALREIDRRFGDRVRFVVAGHAPAGIQGDLLSRIRFEPFLPNIESYWALARQADVVLSVLKRTPATDAKSEIKWLEAAMMATPAVVSSTETFGEVIADGEDGILASDTAEFTDALSRLVSDASLRETIGSAALRKVEAIYGPERMSANLASIFAAVELPVRRSLRVLVVNVYYAPQAIGGATRVVIENIRDIRAMYGDDFEFEVFTTQEGGQTPYSVEVYAHEGVRVTAMTAGSYQTVDSTPTDEAAAAVFKRCVERFSPNLVHFHCIQRISAASAEIVGAMGIPYLITAHDGWWICDRQFLYDQDGLVEPYDFNDLYRYRAGAHGLAFDRPAMLLPVLRGAEAILAVSESFAAVYRGTGLHNVRSLANGLPDMVRNSAAVHVRPPSPGFKVRLGHVGGLEPHKGFPLLKQAIQAVRPCHLSLLAVDLAMSPGEERREVWDGTEVRFVARQPQTDVLALYHSIDVLFAPSLWPESFGLVTREAIAAGCWVVASNRGAIGEPVEEDVNGHVIAVDDVTELMAVLRRLDDDVERYTSSPPASAVLRSAVDQARDLAEIYKDVARLREITSTT